MFRIRLLLHRRQNPDELPSVERVHSLANGARSCSNDDEATRGEDRPPVPIQPPFRPPTWYPTILAGFRPSTNIPRRSIPIVDTLIPRAPVDRWTKWTPTTPPPPLDTSVAPLSTAHTCLPPHPYLHLRLRLPVHSYYHPDILIRRRGWCGDFCPDRLAPRGALPNTLLLVFELLPTRPSDTCTTLLLMGCSDAEPNEHMPPRYDHFANIP
mmetsp:Transcript_9241/g.16748  ORF Transcript_9241/g.16748 Transcript_9241/m.16748 type:complete len:211 (+) Transcript_9241:1619-2251(+)